MTKNPAEIAGTRYKNEKLMSRVQKTDGTSRCFAQIENIKRQSLSYYLDFIHFGDDRKPSPGAVQLADGVYVLHNA